MSRIRKTDVFSPGWCFWCHLFPLLMKHRNSPFKTSYLNENNVILKNVRKNLWYEIIYIKSTLEKWLLYEHHWCCSIRISQDVRLRLQTNHATQAAPHQPAPPVNIHLFDNRPVAVNKVDVSQYQWYMPTHQCMAVKQSPGHLSSVKTQRRKSSRRPISSQNSALLAF